tara:strand:+ start:245 stop:385 length:141 start_codon:yes stop_codon:yes gene_type:complete
MGIFLARAKLTQAERGRRVRHFERVLKRADLAFDAVLRFGEVLDSK